ncbi:rhamnulose-1-phosphate aldolase [Companilactobacillus tucceti DSM 20183]|uniref:Rhamnulose-1-phosphate aldolase n=1 Tax=Companilactobacillus tucceti DSM 20183 TaxID=1423811 RepID=A0A0R1IYI9_9LACO|nr:rhamnulose-1-phosphate aldolase [Companilactobacillus tucceti]KRK64304.1 rhamnulose-1-phosphate aldolase [Companilactobacillus tucceti DSM 20183]
MEFKNSKYVEKMCEITNELYKHGWDERNGGNVSLRLTQDEVDQFDDLNKVIRNIPIKFDATPLAGQYYLVTGTGRYFKNVHNYPERDTGLVKITDEGNSVDLLWGFNDGGQPTSEFPAHLMTHIARQKVDSNQRVVMHCHPTNWVALSFTRNLDEKEISKLLWKMQAESLVVFPEGVGIIPYMTPGTNEIGQATADKMNEFRVVMWPHHGIFGCGDSMDEVYGLIETVEKAALIYTTIQSQGGDIKQEITDDDLRDLAKSFGVTPNPKFLSMDKVK